MLESEGEATYVVSTTPKSYGSIRKAKGSCNYAEGAWEDDDFARSVSNERSLDNMRTAFLGKGIVATTILMFFGVLVMLAHSKWTKDGLFPGEGARSRLRDLPGATLKTTQGTPMGELTLESVNEYGPNDHYALALYNLEMIIEPHRDTTLYVEHSSALGGVPSGARFHWLLVSSSDDGDPIEGVEPIKNGFSGSEVVVNVKETGNYFLLVRQFQPDGRVVAEGQVAVSCKYVRREIRRLNNEDRTAYFEAMQIVYNTSSEEGRSLFGEAFNDYILMVGYHNSMNFCYHVGMQFFTSHAAFDLLMERSLQQVNPKVALAFWDFMLDSGTLGTEWTKSEIFRPDWFGSAHGDPEQHYQIKDGRFGNISNVYDPDNDLMDSSISPAHNSYGFIYDRFDYTQSSAVVRSHSFCGMTGEFIFPMCDTLVGCFEYGNFSDWSSCMESYVHATAHGMIGGGHRCNVDMEDYLSRHPEYTRGLLTFALEFLTIIEWPSNSLMSDYNSCNTTCSIGESCGCECTENVFNWTENEIRSVWNFPLYTMDTRYGGDAYVDYNASYHWPLGFMQDGMRLSENETTELLRQLAFIGCQPGSIGGMSSGAAPLDPLFWVVHPIFEKSLHVLQLAPQYRDSVNFTWVDSDCTGSGYTDSLPFTEKLLGFGNGTDFLTNAELLEYLNPMANKTNYIYDDFTTWGTCTEWDPCPSCTMASLERMRGRTSGEEGAKGAKGPSKSGTRASDSRR